MQCITKSIAAMLGLLVAITAAQSASALDHVVFKRDDKQTRLSGQVIVSAKDGGLMIMTDDGLIWTVQPDELVEHKNDAEPFALLGGDALEKRLLAELPRGFETHRTAHYLICHNTSRQYAAWYGSLVERLYRAFMNYWSRKGLKLRDPEHPLVAIVFADRQSYANFARDELGANAGAIVGYYSLRTNRVTTHDLTGLDALRSAESRRGNGNQITAMLSSPEAEPNVATIVHEATHQIAFNCGLQTRFADIPLWLSEGLAIFFETPDLDSAKGWRTVGAVSRSRLAQFRQYQTNRPANSLATLIADDKRLRDPRQAPDAYAEAWALNYHLIRRKPNEYLAYLRLLMEKRPMIWDTPQVRLREFESAFKIDLNRLDADFVRQTNKLR